ncbi:MAG: hypothetical protein ACHQ1H_04200 [Nitrososphaerales archaeon]
MKNFEIRYDNPFACEPELIRYISAWLLGKILRLFFVGVSLRGVTNAWSAGESTILKKRKADPENNARKKRRQQEIMAKVTDLDRQVQKLAKDFSRTTAQAEELAKEVADVSQKIESFGMELASGQELAAALAKTMEASSAKIEMLTAKIAENDQGKDVQPTDNGLAKNDISALIQQVNSTSEKVDALHNQIAILVESGEQGSSSGKEYRDNAAKQESAISEISSRIDKLEREILLKINERLDNLDKNLTVSDNPNTESRYGEVIDHHHTVFPESINPELEEKNPEVNLADEIKKLGDRLAVLENHTSSYGEKLGALQNSIASVTQRLDNIEEAGSRNNESSENEL